MEKLPITIDFQNKAPLSAQIADKVRALIQAQVLLPEDPLPTVRQLAFQLGVNFNTVARAYRALDAEGLIIAWQGRGTFVEETQHTNRGNESKEPDAQRLVEALFVQATALGIPEAEIWKVLKQRVSESQTTGYAKLKNKRRRYRRFTSGSETGKGFKRGISLLRAGSTTHKRGPRTRRKRAGVSRGTF